jgi:LysM repeat protein
MKMPTLPKMPKMPRLPKLPKPQPKRLQATARRAAQPEAEDYEDEPTTRLSSAFIVVLILHVVAVGGIYTFNSIKAHRRGLESVSAGPAVAPKATPQPPAVDPPNPEKPAKIANVATASLTPAQPSATRITPISGNRVYHVRAGDTLSKVASQYGVTADELQEANGLKSGTDIRAGQALNIPSPGDKTVASNKSAATADLRKADPAAAKKSDTAKSAATPAATTANLKTYTVKKGDNPVAIAKKMGVPYDELLRLNKIDDPKKLQVDQVLKIPAKKSK